MLNLSFFSQGQAPHRPASRSAASLAAAGLAVAAAFISWASPSADMVAESLASQNKAGVAGVASEADDSLASVLAKLAQYDRGHDDRVLLEALRWFDRKWAAGDERAIALSQPLQARVCRHHRLQWSWLCESGE